VYGDWRLANGDWRLAIGDWRMANGDWRMAIGDWRLAIGDWRLAIGERIYFTILARSILTRSTVLSRPARLASSFRPPQA